MMYTRCTPKQLPQGAGFRDQQGRGTRSAQPPVDIHPPTCRAGTWGCCCASVVYAGRCSGAAWSTTWILTRRYSLSKSLPRQDTSPLSWSMLQVAISATTLLKTAWWGWDCPRIWRDGFSSRLCSHWSLCTARALPTGMLCGWGGWHIAHYVGGSDMLSSAILAVPPSHILNTLNTPTPGTSSWKTHLWTRPFPSSPSSSCAILATLKTSYESHDQRRW